MPQIQPTTEVIIDQVKYNVADMPEGLQQTIGFLDDWRQHEIDAISDLAMVRAALRDIQNSLVKEIQDWAAKAAEPAQSQPATE
jgi:hypothetical protein